MITLQDLRNATGGQLFGEAAADQFTDFCHDPRFAQSGQLFVALRTATGDRHRLIQDAIQNGVAGILCQQPPACDVTGVTVILVGDTSAALAQWASYMLRQYGTTVIGVTGAIGKSSALAAITAVLSIKYSIYGHAEALPGRDGLVLSLGGLSPEHQIAVLELSPKYAGEMRELLSAAPPHVGVVTRLDVGLTPPGSTDFAEETVRQLADALPAEGTLILNSGDPRLRAMIPSINRGLVTFAQDGSPDASAADLVALNVQYFVDKVGFDLAHQSSRLRGFWTPALGEPGLTAALAALTAGLIFEIPLAQSLRALKEMRPLPGRLIMLNAAGGAALLDDTYHATPASMMASLDLLESIDVGTGRRILAVGDLGEVSDSRRNVTGLIGERARQGVDWLLLLGDQAIQIGCAARSAGLDADKVDVFHRHEDLAATLRDGLKPDDVVLVSGGRQSRMELVCDLLLENRDDRVWLVKRQSRTGELPAAQTTASSWVELDLNALASNLHEIRRRIGPNCSIMAVVKSNAYGHGLVPVAATAVYNGASLLAVGSLVEGIELRQAGIKAPILILGNVPVSAYEDAVQNDLMTSVYDRQMIQALSRAAWKYKRKARVHIRVDTGMGDLGLLPQEVVPLVRELTRLDGVELDGLYMDFAAADTLLEVAATQVQLQRFQTVHDSLRATGVSIPHIHAANSAAIFTLPASYFTVVRPGIAMYGLHPSLDVSVPTGFRRVLTWKSRVVQVRTVPENWYVVSTEVPPSGIKIAVIPVGYADGFRGAPRNWGEVLINGQRAAIVGRVRMDHSAVYASHLPDVQVGDEVVLIGPQGSDEIRAEDVARRLDMTNYEVVAGISPHIPRLNRMEPL